MTHGAVAEIKEQIRQLKGQRDELARQITEMQHDGVVAHVSKLIDALRWYASPEPWVLGETDTGRPEYRGYRTCAALDDAGKRARAALRIDP